MLNWGHSYVFWKLVLLMFRFDLILISLTGHTKTGFRFSPYKDHAVCCFLKRDFQEILPGRASSSGYTFLHLTFFLLPLFLLRHLEKNWPQETNFLGWFWIKDVAITWVLWTAEIRSPCYWSGILQWFFSFRGRAHNHHLLPRCILH